MVENGSRNLSGEPHRRTPLPPDLAGFLRGQETACLLHPTDQGTAFVIKLPRRELASVGGRLPIRLRHELYSHPAAPVIRTVLTLFDQPDRPLALETFINAEQEDQRSDYARLISQDQLPLLFYDEQLVHRLTKLVPNQPDEQVGDVLRQAQALLARIPPERFSFERAKQAVMRVTKLAP